MLDLYPYLKTDYEKYEEKKEKAQRLRDYDKLVPLLESDNDRLKKQVEALKKVAEAHSYPKL